MNSPHPLQEAVQTILNKRNESKYSLAKKIGADPKCFGQVLRRDVRLSTFFKLAEALEVSPADLITAVDKLRK